MLNRVVLKRIVQSILTALGFQITKTKNALTMNGALRRCRERGINVNTVIDIGASDGRWTEDCLRYFPNADYLMVDAQDAHSKKLNKLKAKKEKVDFVIAAAGKTDGKIYFDNSDLYGGLASETPLEGDCIEVPVISIDNEIKRRNLKGPFLLKLDTHGFELPILEGAMETIKQSALIVLETYNYQLTDDSLKYHEMCSYMEKLGFSSIEMVDLMTRKYDNSFWQMDIFYIPSKSKEFAYNKYE